MYTTIRGTRGASLGGTARYACMGLQFGCVEVLWSELVDARDAEELHADIDFLLEDWRCQLNALGFWLAAHS